MHPLAKSCIITIDLLEKSYKITRKILEKSCKQSAKTQDYQEVRRLEGIHHKQSFSH